MKNITAEPRRIVRALVIATALSALAACSVIDDGTPFLKIKGSIVTNDAVTASGWSWGSATRVKNCNLKMYDLNGTLLTDQDVYGSTFRINWSSRYVYDTERGAYPGVSLEVSCPNGQTALVAITDADMLANNSKINLEKVYVQ